MYQLFRPSLLLLVLQSNGSLGGLRGQGRAGDEQEDPVYIPTYHPALAAYLLVENQNNLRLTAATGLQCIDPEVGQGSVRVPLLVN